MKLFTVNQQKTHVYMAAWPHNSVVQMTLLTVGGEGSSIVTSLSGPTNDCD